MGYSKTFMTELSLLNEKSVAALTTFGPGGVIGNIGAINVYMTAWFSP